MILSLNVSKILKKMSNCGVKKMEYYKNISFSLQLYDIYGFYIQLKQCMLLFKYKNLKTKIKKFLMLLVKRLTEKGITLIALVITIVILLILAAVGIGTLTGENGLIKRAQDAKNNTLDAGNLENATFGDLENLIDSSTGTTNGENSGGGTTGGDSGNTGGSAGGNGGTPTGTVDSTSKVGYYAKIGDEYGVIFADLAVGGSGDWNPANNSWATTNKSGAYTIPTKTGLKSYVISEESHTETGYGTHPVLKAADGTTGNDRFYVMALKDIDGKKNGTFYDWYNAAYKKITDYSTVTSQDFGTGKTNTATMISKWDNTEYGEKDQGSNYKDMWGQIKTKVANGWFVPSRAEWAAFGKTFDYSNTVGQLSINYWSSSLRSSSSVYFVDFSNSYIRTNYVDNSGGVRLATTF